MKNNDKKLSKEEYSGERDFQDNGNVRTSNMKRKELLENLRYSM